jgi:SAM-dependent methyltransferase
MASLGELPRSSRFAHGLYPGHFPDSQLQRCSDCHSLQRHPVLKQSDYTALYASAQAMPWAGHSQRNDHRTIASLINADPALRSVLDIGAGDGALLALLNPDISKAAIEPSPSAQLVLRAKSVEIAGDDVSTVDAKGRYDAVTIVDVIEHFVDPAAVLLSAAAALRDQGKLFISTGNPEAAAWVRQWKGRFWYCSYQEHLTFPSARGLTLIGEKAGLQLTDFREISYEDLSTPKRLQYLAQQWSYGAVPAVHLAAMAVAKRFRFGTAWADYVHSHASGVYRDHYVAVLEKQSA